MLELWYASPYWDPQSDPWEVREVQDIHIQKTLTSRSMHWLKLIKWKYIYIYKLKFWLGIDCSSRGAQEDKITADNGFNCPTISRFV